MSQVVPYQFFCVFSLYPDISFNPIHNLLSVIKVILGINFINVKRTNFSYKYFWQSQNVIRENDVRTYNVDEIDTRSNVSLISKRHDNNKAFKKIISFCSPLWRIRVVKVNNDEDG